MPRNEHDQAIPPHVQNALMAAAREASESINDSLANEIRAATEELKRKNDYLPELQARMAAVEQVVAMQGTRSTGSMGSTAAMGTAFQAAVNEDAAFAQLKGWNQVSARINMDGVGLRAALVNEPYDPSPTSNGSIPSQPERAGIVGPVIAQPRLLNFLRTRQVFADSVEYIKLNTTGDVDYQDGEGTEKAGVEFDGTPNKAHIVTIAGFTTASRQVLADHATLSQHIDTVLRAKLLNKLSYELINGQGGGGVDTKIEGLVKQGAIMALPAMTSFADRVGEAIVRQGNLGFQSGLIVINPLTWLEEIATAKTQTEHAYLFGSPASPLPPALWNLPVALEPSLPQGHAMVLDLNYVTVLDRERASVMLSNSHADYFRRNLVAILGELRAGLEVLDEGAVMIVEPGSTTN